ncbi:PAS domain S-box protein [Chloroflexota bacterium]
MGNKGKTKEQLLDELAALRQRIIELEKSESERKQAEEKGKQHIHNLAFLSETAVSLVELSPEEDIYKFAGEKLKELIGDCIIFVNSFNEASASFCVRAVIGIEDHLDTITKLLGKHPVGISTPINDEARTGLTSGKLQKVPGGLYTLAVGTIPEDICKTIENLLGTGDAYSMGFTWRGELFGSASFLMRKGAELRDPSIIETFVHQASVALQRRQANEALQKARDELEIQVRERTVELTKTNEILRGKIDERKQAEEKLRESERKYRELTDLLPQSVFEIDLSNKFTFANSCALESFRYTMQDFEKGINAFQLFIPEDHEKLTANIQRRLRGEDIGGTEYTALRKDGSTFPMLVYTAPVIHGNRPAGLRGIAIDLTERKQAEEALRESERKYRLLVDGASNPITLYDTNGMLLLMNTRAAKTLGSVPDAYVGKSIYELYPSAADMALERIRQVAESGESHAFETVIEHGSRREWFWSSFQPVSDTTGKVFAVQIITYDITREKQAREALEESEAKYSALVERAEDGVVIIQDKVYKFANKAYQTIFGYTNDELVGMHFLDLVAPESRKLAVIIQARRIAGKDVLPAYELKVRCKDGTIKELESSGAIINYQGKPASMGIVRDVTKRKQAEERLQESEQKFRALTEQSSNMIFISTNGRVVYANKKCEEVMGYTREEFYAPDFYFFVLIAPESRPLVEQSFRKHSEGKEVTPYEYNLITKDGSRIDALFFSKLITYQGKPSIMGTVTDITEIKRAKEMLQEAYEKEVKLRQAVETEMNKRIEFTRALVHELKTPLTPIMSSSELLLDELQNEPWLNLVTNIHRSASKLNSRIDELFDLTRGEMGMLTLNLKPINMLDLLRSVADEMAPAASSSQQYLVLNTPSSLPTITADENRLRQIMTNLLINAFKFAPLGGKITLEAKQMDTAVIVAVQDTGPGIDKSEQQRLFDPYYRLSSDRERFSGLGLALCKAMVELHGGKIWVESKMGKGSTFSFSIPLEVPSP